MPITSKEFGLVMTLDECRALVSLIDAVVPTGPMSRSFYFTLQEHQAQNIYAALQEAIRDDSED